MKYSKKILTFVSAFAVSLGLFAVNANTTFAASNSKPADTSSTKVAKSTKSSSSKADGSKTNKKQKAGTQRVTGYAMMTKVAGNKNYKVWKSVSGGHVHTKVTDGITYRYNHIQSDQSVQTKKSSLLENLR